MISFTVDLRPSTLRPRSMFGRCLMRIPCLPNWLVLHLLQARLYTRVLAIPARRELARMPVVPDAFRCLRTESSPAWCNELRFLFPVNYGIPFLSPRPAHLAGRDRLVAALKAEFGISLKRPEAQLSQVRSRRHQCRVRRPNHRFQGYQVSSPSVRGSDVNRASDYCWCAYGARSWRYLDANCYSKIFGAHRAYAQPIGVSVLHAKDPSEIENSTVAILRHGGRIYIPHAGDRSSSHFGNF